MVPRIKVEELSNRDDVRRYHTTVVISQFHRKRFWHPLTSGSDKHLENIGEAGATLVREALAIPGVVEVRINPYAFSVAKGMAFGWEEVEPSIIEALKKAFGETAEEIVVIPCFPPEPTPEVASEKPQ